MAECDRLDAELLLMHAILQRGHGADDKSDKRTVLQRERDVNDKSNECDKRIAGQVRYAKRGFGELDRSWLVLHEEEHLEPATLALADELLRRRLAGVPLAYILGYKEFYGHNFWVTPDVLIPRPETEDLVDISVKMCCGDYSGSEMGRFEEVNVGHDESGVKRFEGMVPPSNIVDVGTGSGCIAISVALELQQAIRSGRLERLPRVLALDNSTAALRVARANVKDLGAKITLLKSDLLKGYARWQKETKTMQREGGIATDKARLNSVPAQGREGNSAATLVVANLPYVDDGWEWLSPGLKYEPAEALYAADGGLMLIKRLIREVEQYASLADGPFASSPSGVSVSVAGEAFMSSTGRAATFLDVWRFSGAAPIVYLLLEADFCQHRRIIDYALRHHFRHLLTRRLALLFLLDIRDCFCQKGLKERDGNFE